MWRDNNGSGVYLGVIGNLKKRTMNIDKIINFLKTDIWGLIILGVVSSVLAGIIYDFLKSKYKSTHQTIKKKDLPKDLSKLQLHLDKDQEHLMLKMGRLFNKQFL